MTIPNDKRLAFLRQTAATQSRTHIEVERSEFISILDELIEKRANPVVELRADRVRLQGEIERLTHELAEAQSLRSVCEDRADAWAAAKEWIATSRKQTDIEALAQRLAKVEDQLTALAHASEDILKAVELLAEVVFDELAETPSTEAAFPTGAATTVEEVIAQAEEPSAESDDAPRRGDRVRLEGARSIGNTKLEDGWYDVTGSTALDFQVKAGIGCFWVGATDPSLKEVRRGAAKLPE